MICPIGPGISFSLPGPILYSANLFALIGFRRGRLQSVFGQDLVARCWSFHFRPRILGRWSWPIHDFGPRIFRWNWSRPVHISATGFFRTTVCG